MIKSSQKNVLDVGVDLGVAIILSCLTTGVKLTQCFAPLQEVRARLGPIHRFKTPPVIYRVKALF